MVTSSDHATSPPYVAWSLRPTTRALSDDRPLGRGSEPACAPDRLLQQETFALTAPEADYLRDRLLASTRGSMLAWILLHHAALPDVAIWRHPATGTFPAPSTGQSITDAGCTPSSNCAALLDDLLLAEQRPSAELAASTKAISRAGSTISKPNDRSTAGTGTTSGRFYTRVDPRICPATRASVDSWVDGIAANPTAVASSDPLRELIRKREWQMKGPRSRFKNRAALDNWTGGSGLARLDYRWPMARRLLRDIVAGTGEAI